ncbi:Neuromedin-U [Manis javanica]|nr:Neuromedin-U [Manis javanica]
MPRAASCRPAPRPLLLLLLACCAGACRGAPVLPQGLWPEQELQLWSEIVNACSSFLSMDSQPQASNALEELCITITGTLPKPQETDEKDNAKRFLFHYSKTQKLGNSNVVSSVNEEIQSGRRIPRSFCKPKSKILFIQATKWKKVRRLHLNWIPTIFHRNNAMEI